MHPNARLDLSSACPQSPQNLRIKSSPEVTERQGGGMSIKSPTIQKSGIHTKHMTWLKGAWGELRVLAMAGRLTPLARDALLFLALALAAVSLDSPLALWSLWWPLPLAALGAVLT